MRKIIPVSLLVAIFLSGCWLMPYQENFSCAGDIGAGNCKMVRENLSEKEEHNHFVYQKRNMTRE